MATIDELVSLVPPPAAPVDGDGDWQTVEEALGVRLPTDYKLLVGRYGFGEFADITLLTPFSEYLDGAYDLVEGGLSLVERFQSLREASPERYPFPLYPEPGGVLEWAIASENTSLCWLTEGEPDTWPVAAWNPVSARGDRYKMGAVELLHAYLSGRRKVPLLGPAPREPWFEPHRERSTVWVQLSKSELPYREQLQRLREVMAPTVDRGSVNDRRNKRRADSFKATDRDWLVIFEDHYGYRICLDILPGDEDEARPFVFEAAQAMGCRVLAAVKDESPIWIYGDEAT
ncbi:MAG TPA: hypothetical protein VF062_13920 [Candidatus Limnocylindrales bacterium]